MGSKVLRVRNLGSIVVRRMLEVWVSGGSGTHEHKRDTTVYPGSGYRGPTSSTEEFFVFKSTQIGGYIEGE